MSALPPDALDRIDRIGGVWDGWRPGSTRFDAAHRATVEAFGYEPAVIEAQLLRSGVAFARGCAAARALAAAELRAPVAGGAGQNVAPQLISPRCILHLAGPAVPGLLPESVSWGLVLGSRQLVHTSLDEAVLGPWLDQLQAAAPELGALVEVVDDVEWAAPDAAIVHGSDATLAHVREQLGQTAPVAAFGSREAIAVITERGIADHADWADRLHDDLTRFHGNGCMTPRHVWLLGTSATLKDARVQLLQRAASELSPIEQRHRTDEAMLDAVAASTGQSVEPSTAVPDPDTMAGPLPVELQPDRAALERAVRSLGTRLQTAVLVCADAERAPLADLLGRCGVTRLCDAGHAHDPSPWWPHDGRGRLRDLARWTLIDP